MPRVDADEKWETGIRLNRSGLSAGAAPALPSQLQALVANMSPSEAVPRNGADATPGSTAEAKAAGSGSGSDLVRHSHHSPACTDPSLELTADRCLTAAKDCMGYIANLGIQ